MLDLFRNRLLLIAVTGFYVILFMNLYQPFNVNNWFRNDSIPQFVILSGFGVITMVVLSVSQLYIREILKVRKQTVLGVLVWFFVELMLLTMTMFFIYGDLSLKGFDLFNELVLSFKYTLLVLVIPYTGILFYLHHAQKVEKDATWDQSVNRLLNISDENGEVHMAVELDRLLFIRSADNYVEVCYLKDAKVTKELVRTTLKRLESELTEFPVRRCHRSFMVNTLKISVSLKNDRGLELSLQNYDAEKIPVSKNYKSFFIGLMK